MSLLLSKYMSPIIDNVRETFTKHQTEILISRFKSKPYLRKGEKDQLARQLNVSEKRIETWYHNRRSKGREGDISKTRSETSFVYFMYTYVCM